MAFALGVRRNFLLPISCYLFCMLQCTLFATAQSSSQQTDFLVDTIARVKTTQLSVRSITIRGNEITREAVILRELPFTKGSTIAIEDIPALLEKARIYVSNTQLFLEVAATIVDASATHIDIEIAVKERWYILPVPQFKLADRNFNQWWKEQHRSMERVNYGVKLYWNNTTGRSDKLRLFYLNGYSRQFLLEYEMPFIDRKMEKGFGFSAGYVQSRQMQYATDADKQVFYPAANNEIGRFVRSTFRTQASFTVRKGVRHRHAFRLAYVADQIPDTIASLIRSNSVKGFMPFYQNNGARQRYLEAIYQYQYFSVDNIAYPLRGETGQLMLMRRGIGNNALQLWQLNAQAATYFFIGQSKNTSLSVQAYGMAKLPFQQPYININALGYSEWFLRGLEYYVIDGVMAGMLKTTLRRKILDVRLPTVLTRSEKYREIPFKVMFKLYGDFGATHHPTAATSVLSNRLLYTAGAGIDVLSYYDFVARFEYSINQLGEKGLFLHLQKAF
ncbi:MAG: POTRA domain-containing protein [Chitinophagaceae bacterium]